jgi:hypothetical protein
MFALVYVSSATNPFSREELAQLLEKARTNNAARSITGMLLYKDGNFMQVLEGEREAVEQLARQIGTDPRHHGMMVLLKQEQPDREFAAWSMGFRELTDDDIRRMQGFDEFMNIDATRAPPANAASKLLSLLRTFRRTMS